MRAAEGRPGAGISCYGVIKMLAGGAIFCFVVMQLSLHREASVLHELNQEKITGLRKESPVKSSTDKMNAEGYPVGSDPADFGRAFSVYNNANRNVRTELDGVDPDGKVLVEVEADLNMGVSNHYYLPWHENTLVFRYFLDHLEIARHLSKAPYRICDSDERGYSSAGVELKPLLTKSDTAIGALYDRYCVFGEPSASAVKSQPSLRGAG